MTGPTGLQILGLRTLHGFYPCTPDSLLLSRDPAELLLALLLPLVFSDYLTALQT